MLTEDQHPGRAGRSAWRTRSSAHPASGYAVVGVAAVVPIDGQGTPHRRASPSPARPRKRPAPRRPSRALTGKPLTDDNIAAAAQAVTNGLELNGDYYASAEFRAHLLQVYTKRALERAAAQVK